MKITGLGYIGLTATDLDAWRTWATNVVGFSIEDPTPGVSSLAADEVRHPDALYLRMDDRRQRIVVYPGDEDGFAYVGWELQGRIHWEDALAKLDACKYPYTVASENEALERGVQGMAWLIDPAGYRHELFYSAYYMEDSFESPCRPMREGFRTDNGIGHIVLIVPQFSQELDQFAARILGMTNFAGGVSIPNKSTIAGDDGRVRTEMYRGELNQIVHNFVYMEKAGCAGIHHIGLEFGHLDDLGRCYDRVLAKCKDKLIMTLGRHQADTNISFYVSSPSRVIFEIVYGSELIPNDKLVAQRPLHSFAWGLKQVGPVLQDHLLIANQKRRCQPVPSSPALAAEQADVAA